MMHALGGGVALARHAKATKVGRIWIFAALDPSHAMTAILMAPDLAAIGDRAERRFGTGSHSIASPGAP
jgi:hypothetical protein